MREIVNSKRNWIMRKAVLFLAFGLAVAACTGKNNPDSVPGEKPFVPTDTTLVVVGQELVPGKNYYDAVVYLDGGRLCLSDGSHDAFCNAVYAYRDTIYIVGAEAVGELIDDGYYDPYNANNGVLWSFVLGKTDEVSRTVYSGVAQNSSAVDVVYTGGKVHACGFDTPGGYDRRALWWRGEDKIELTDGSADALAYCIAADGADVYIGGYVQSSENSRAGSAVIWKNGELQKLTGGDVLAKVNEISVVGGHVYAAGAYREPDDNGWRGAVWTDGELNLFTEDVGVEVYGFHVYEDGSWIVNGNMTTEDRRIVACNWHSNGSVEILSGQLSVCQGAGLLVLDDDVYSLGNAIGYDDDYNVVGEAYLWKNGGRVSDYMIGNKDDYSFWDITAALY